jgi:hypothetical protein
MLPQARLAVGLRLLPAVAGARWLCSGAETPPSRARYRFSPRCRLAALMLAASPPEGEGWLCEIGSRIRGVEADAARNGAGRLPAAHRQSSSPKVRTRAPHGAWLPGGATIATRVARPYRPLQGLDDGAVSSVARDQSGGARCWLKW